MGQQVYRLQERLSTYLHHRVKRRFGIWLRPERCALVSFLNFIDSSKPEACYMSAPSP